MMRVLLILLALVICAPGAMAAQNGRRFAQPRITFGEWQQYQNEVKAIPGVDTEHPQNRPNTIAYYVQSQDAAYFFTTGGTVYPAVVVFRFFDRTDKIELVNYGYYAGAEDAFAEWFSTFGDIGPELAARFKLPIQQGSSSAQAPAPAQ